MQVLGLSTERTSVLLASRYPEQAEVYVCDRCGRDITKHLFIRRSGHGGVPIGRPLYVCVCGASYRTGAREWDYKNRLEKRSDLKYLSISLSMLLAPIATGTLTYLGFTNHSTVVLVSAFILLLLSIIPTLFGVFAVWSIVQIAASIVRTRILRTSLSGPH